MTRDANLANFYDKHYAIIDVDGPHIKIGLCPHDGAPSVHQIKSYSALDFTSLNEALVKYAEEVAIDISNRHAAISVSGPVTGDFIKIARCPWALSVNSIKKILGKDCFFINDSIAKAWADVDAPIQAHRPMGSAKAPNFNVRGSWAAVNYVDGLGAAIMVNDGKNRLRHSSSEIGHAAFSPFCEKEQQLLTLLQNSPHPVSWEQAITLNYDDPIWQKIVGISGLNAKMNIKAGILGSFVGDLILSLGAWSGIFLHGHAVKLLTMPEQADFFNRRVENRANYRSQLMATPRWLNRLPNVNLIGAAQFLRNQIANIES
ncbi:hypothetical protein LPB140_05510 [Sphingorhabdus lutea]|uniref:Glucokinase n=1 Tax=Sphingorhabdus lutea TaxID=1913578 RepID=A0A1L3JB24_9SPHN|nr:glucokinase [Sphingorhabdus lutea]APG62344.1 hypothetical protein LPB140_05510 [Sphingorhabdus lutea]